MVQYLKNNYNFVRIMKNNCSVIILAAGNSSRMGKPKFLMEMPNGVSFLENITKQYAVFGCLRIIVVLNSESIKLIEQHKQNLPVNTKLILNTNSKLGRFSSIRKGITAVNTNFVLIHNIDNPYAKKEVLGQIYNKKLQAEVIKPVFNNRGGHPVLISKKVCEDILLEKENNLNFKDFLRRYSIKKAEVEDDSILLNINTNEELVEFMNIVNR